MNQSDMPSAVNSETESATDAKPSALTGLSRVWPVGVVAAAVFAVDQLTKYLIRANLAIGESWPSEGFFRLTHGTNTGTIFGLFPQQTLLLTLASFFAIGFVIYFYRAHGGSGWLSQLNIGLLLGGAFGNLLDRLAWAKVTDFIDVGPWPIFNIADSSIVVGITLLIATTLLYGDRQDAPQELGNPGEDEGGRA